MTENTTTLSWIIEISLDNEEDRDRVLKEIERLIHDMGEIGTISSYSYEFQND